MLLELLRQLGVAEQHGRAGAVRPELPHGRDASIDDPSMPAQAQIILRGEVDALACGGADVADSREWAVRSLQRSRVGPEPERGAALDERIEALGPLDEVRSRWIAEMRQRLVQNARPILGAQLGD